MFLNEVDLLSQLRCGVVSLLEISSNDTETDSCKIFKLKEAHQRDFFAPFPNARRSQSDVLLVMPLTLAYSALLL